MHLFLSCFSQSLSLFPILLFRKLRWKSKFCLKKKGHVWSHFAHVPSCRLECSILFRLLCCFFAAKQQRLLIQFALLKFNQIRFFCKWVCHKWYPLYHLLIGKIFVAITGQKVMTEPIRLAVTEIKAVGSLAAAALTVFTHAESWSLSGNRRLVWTCQSLIGGATKPHQPIRGAVWRREAAASATTWGCCDRNRDRAKSVSGAGHNSKETLTHHFLDSEQHFRLFLIVL